MTDTRKALDDLFGPEHFAEPEPITGVCIQANTEQEAAGVLPPAASPRLLRFTIPGRAQPAGSKRAVPLGKTGRVSIVDANPKAAGWKKSVQRWVSSRYTSEPLTGPIRLDLVIYLPRPISRPGSQRAYPTVAPDVLKLARGIEDALTGIIYTDDAQIVSEHLHKRYGEPRVEVTITELAE